MDLTLFKALSSDAEGTLIDWETGIRNALQPMKVARYCNKCRKASGEPGGTGGLASRLRDAQE